MSILSQAFKSIFIFILAICPAILQASASLASAAPEAHLALISNLSKIEAGKEIMVGVKLQLPKGWSTFWRSPGEVGYPIQFDWAGSKNLKSTAVLWPYPRREKIYDFYANVYEHSVIFPVKIKLIHDQAPVEIHLKVNYLLCQPGACIPQTQEASLSLPVGKSKPGKEAPLLLAALEKIPVNANSAQLAVKRVMLTPISEQKVNMTVDVSSLQTPEKTELFVEGPKELVFSLPKFISSSGQQASYRFEVQLAEGVSGDMDLREWLQKPIDLTVVNQGKALTLSIQPQWQGEQLAMPAEGDQLSLSLILIFAFVGGLILNLMPCVLPILSLKILTLQGMENKRLHGIFYSLGVLVSFALIAFLIIFLKKMGLSAGWGFQMQSPVFLISLIYLFTLIAFNLFGFYEVPFSLQRKDKKHNPRQLAYAFSTGVLACVVATPCTAPFMATAVGVAFYQGSWTALLIFLSLGLGFAMPYLLICWIPPVRQAIPKPGLWMERLKQFLGFPMLLSVVWLLWVTGHLLNLDAVILILISLCFLALGIWLAGVLKTKTMKYLSWLLCLLLIIAPLWSLYQSQNTMVDAGIERYDYSPEKLAQLRQENRRVLVYATALWCITCKFNEALVLDSATAYAFYRKNHIVLMKADWTNKNTIIYHYLASFNRAGVPLYVFYPGQSKPVVLPQILTTKAFINQIKSSF